MALFSLVLMNTGCDEQFDQAKLSPSGEGKMVEVSLNIGFADETDGATLAASQATKSSEADGRQAAFDMQLMPAAQTKAATNSEATTSHPDQLYNLEIYQYTTNGAYLASITDIGTIATGTDINRTLSDNSGNECQLLIIARGATGAVSSLGTKSLSEVNAITADTTKMKTVNASTGENINNMPYLLHLPKVKIVNGKITSPEGTDVRLLLKRLAVGLTINWKFSTEMTQKGYTLSEVRLMQVPKDYRILPATEEIAPYGKMYPTSVSEFVDGFRLKGTTLQTAGGNNGSQTLWIPANARGTRSDVTYPNYRNKNYAHSAATFVEFVVNKDNQRLLYRAYLGANNTSDFNLLENTNYNWTININNDNYTNDPRIQPQDLAPVISTNLQITSNCFMMKPGTNICFNPYRHEAGTGSWNTYLTKNGAIDTENNKQITKVEVLWQSKDAGTSGDLVLGYVASDGDHRNLVNYENLDNVESALVHVKVPNTQGGNAVIAAYHENTIVWSWHIWVSDYVPAGINQAINSEDDRKNALAAARAASKEGTVHQYRGAAWTFNTGTFYNKVIMDRNLGALRGTWSTTNSLESARAYGNLYEWGRKDPLPGSADGGRDDIDLMFDGNGVSMSLVLGKNSDLNMDNSIKYPTTFFPTQSSNIQNLPSNSWGATKTIYDPCPEGWQVPDFTTDSKKNIWSDFNGWTNLSKLVNGKWSSSGSSNDIKAEDFNIMNGMRYKLSDNSSETSQDDYAWFPFFRPRELFTGLLRDPYRNEVTGEPYDKFHSNLLPCYILYGAEQGSNTSGWYFELKYAPNTPSGSIAQKTYGFGIRCIQSNNK